MFRHRYHPYNFFISHNYFGTIRRLGLRRVPNDHNLFEKSVVFEKSKHPSFKIEFLIRCEVQFRCEFNLHLVINSPGTNKEIIEIIKEAKDFFVDFCRLHKVDHKILRKTDKDLILVSEPNSYWEIKGSPNRVHEVPSDYFKIISYFNKEITKLIKKWSA